MSTKRTHTIKQTEEQVQCVIGRELGRMSRQLIGRTQTTEMISSMYSKLQNLQGMLGILNFSLQGRCSLSAYKLLREVVEKGEIDVEA